MDQLRDVHYKKVANLQHEISKTKALIEKLEDHVQKYSLTQQHLLIEYKKSLQEDRDKIKHLQECVLANEDLEQGRKDLEGLKDTVNKDLQTLHNVYDILVQDIEFRTKKKGIAEDADEASSGGTLAQIQSISFLENNFEQFIIVHKQLFKDDADLKYKFPELEEILRNSMDHAKAINSALKDAYEGLMSDMKSHQYEVIIKDAMNQINLANEIASPQLANPIKAAQHNNISIDRISEDEQKK